MLRIDGWLSISILGLVLLFVFISISFYNFLIGPNGKGPTITIDISSSFIQIIFLTIGPAIALSVFLRPISTSISKLSIILVFLSGLVIILGMIYDSTLVNNIKINDVPEWILYVPWIFILFGILLIFISLKSLKSFKDKTTRTLE